MQDKVFSIRQSLSIYVIIVLLFYISSTFFQTRYGLAGIPLTQVFGLLVPALLAVLLMKKDFKSVFFFNTTQSFKYYRIGLGLWLLALVLSGIYSFYAIDILPEEKEMLDAFNYIFENLSLLNQILMIAVLPAIIEELLFRGLFLSSLLKHTRPSIAIFATSLMFAAMHLSLLKLFTTFILGSTFGYVVYKSKSIFPAIFLHFVNNSFSVLIAYYLSDFDLVEPMMINQSISITMIAGLISLTAITIMTQARGILDDYQTK